MKRIICFLLTLFVLLPVFSLTADAAEPEFTYELTVDGKDTVEVNTGDIITVTLHLYRTDEESPYTMYAMQDEIRYDSNFFELVEGSELLASGIQSTDIGLVDQHREFYMNYLSFSGGVQWEPKTRVGSFQLRVIGESGVTTITNEDFLVSLKDGSGSYPCDANKLTVILTTECTVKFETNGGTPIDPITAIYGETISRPEDPVRAGKHLVGWFKDIHLQEEWNFETDTVSGNMTLYAKWADGDPVVPGEDNEISVVMLLLIALLAALFGWLLWLFLLWKRKTVKYSLITGDVSLDFKNGDVPAEVSVVLYDGEKEYHLNKSGMVDVKHRLKFIKNVTSIPVAVIAPGTYKGKLLIHEGNKIRVRKCRIKALDKELNEK